MSANSSSLNPKGSISAASSSGIGGGGHFSSVQRQIQQDWSNREYIEDILSNIKKITDFLNTFDLSCRSKLAILDEKLTKLEREIDFVAKRNECIVCKLYCENTNKKPRTSNSQYGVFNRNC